MIAVHDSKKLAVELRLGARMTRRPDAWNTMIPVLIPTTASDGASL